MNLVELRAAAEQCTLCKLSQNSTIFDRGNQKAAIMVCGSASVGIDNNMELFTKRENKLLAAILKASNLTDEQIYITNLIKCMTMSEKDITPSCINDCFSFLMAQIALIGPKLVIVLGKLPLATLLGEDVHTVEVINGVLVRYAKHINILPTYHPNYIAKTGGILSAKFKESVNHFTKARNMCYF